MPFADYAGFLLAYPGWPGEQAMRRVAERRIDPLAAVPSEVARFFDRFPPLTVAGQVRYAEALAGIGRSAEAFAAARAAWTGGRAERGRRESAARALRLRLHARAIRIERMDRLLWDGATAAATRQIAFVSPAARPLLDARLALRTQRADAGDIATTALAIGGNDAGFVADRARFLRDTGQSVTARSWLATPRTLATPPLDAEKYLEILLQAARGADADNQPSFVVGIALQADGAFPPGTDVRLRSLGERDDYTSLTFLGGMAALRKLNRPLDAMLLFDRYSRAAQSPQTRTRGLYWAGARRARRRRSAARQPIFRRGRRQPRPVLRPACLGAARPADRGAAVRPGDGRSGGARGVPVVEHRPRRPPARRAWRPCRSERRSCARSPPR